MKLKRNLFILLVFTAFGSRAYAADDDTMMVVAEGATPQDIVKVIKLPDFASSSADSGAAFGHDPATQAKEWGKEFGQLMAEEVKNNNISEQIRDDIQQNARRDARGGNGRGRAPDR